MALTQNQYNQHVHDILVGAFPSTTELTDDLRVVLVHIIRRLTHYHRLGTDQDEAARRLLGEIIDALRGPRPAAPYRHALVNHIAEEAGEPSGELA